MPYIISQEFANTLRVKDPETLNTSELQALEDYTVALGWRIGDLVLLSGTGGAVIHPIESMGSYYSQHGDIVDTVTILNGGVWNRRDILDPVTRTPIN